MKHSDAIRSLVESQMDDTRARQFVEVLETLFTDEIGACQEALDELRTAQEQSRIEFEKLRADYEKLRADVTTSVGTLRVETTRSASSIESSVLNLYIELNTRLHDQTRYVVQLVLGLVALASAASASIAFVLAHH